jgi:tetratricopeptide (TPR) repeat protein
MAREQRVNAAVIAETRAHLGVARQLEALHQTDRAIEQLQDLIAEKPAAPYGALATGYLRLGEAYDRLGERPHALQAYRSAAGAAPAEDIHEIRDEARKRIRETPDRKKAEAYRLSLQGWRRLERKDLEGASEALERALELGDRSPVTRYRYGRVLQARRDDAAALAQFDLAIKDAKLCPAPILGEVYLEAARLHERGGNREQALSWYRVTAALFGAAEETRSAATRAINRLEKEPRSAADARRRR